VKIVIDETKLDGYECQNFVTYSCMQGSRLGVYVVTYSCDAGVKAGGSVGVVYVVTYSCMQGSTVVAAAYL